MGRHEKGQGVRWANSTEKTPKLDLIKKLQEKGVTTTGNINNIRKLATSHGVPVIEVLQKIIEGWEGKPKGILQVLWEHSWIVAHDLQQYTVNGEKYSFGILQPETSLKHLMANCRDYEEEELLLQSMGQLMGVVVDCMPKCHCELAGKGIEYSKNAYWQLPLSEKRGKQASINSVKKCLTTNILTKECVQKFSKRARKYICAYHTVWQQKQESTANSNEEVDSPKDEAIAIPVKIKKLVKMFKTHCCALDFDQGFITALHIVKNE